MDVHATQIKLIGMRREARPIDDSLFNLIFEALYSPFRIGALDSLADEILRPIDQLLLEHHLVGSPESRLSRLIPTIGVFHTPLPFLEAFRIYNHKYQLTKRRFIPPTIDEIRHILNIAQIVAVRPHLRLITFDGDETLYPDGTTFTSEETAFHIVTLLKRGITVAIVTAAGYGYASEKYEQRLVGLLEYFKTSELSSDDLGKFYVFGGECNYLLRCGADYHLSPVNSEEWHMYSPVEKMNFDEIGSLLSVAAKVMDEAIDELSLRGIILQKERAVGIVPGGSSGRKRNPSGSGDQSLKGEILEEIVLRVKDAIASKGLNIPYCAFNGNRDVWVDVGNKAIGIKILQQLLHINPSECLHVGDQFLPSGNDIAARNACPTVWISNPKETNAVLRSLLRSDNKSPPLEDKRPTSLKVEIGDFQQLYSPCRTPSPCQSPAEPKSPAEHKTNI